MEWLPLGAISTPCKGKGQWQHIWDELCRGKGFMRKCKETTLWSSRAMRIIGILFSSPKRYEALPSFLSQTSPFFSLWRKLTPKRRKPPILAVLLPTEQKVADPPRELTLGRAEGHLPLPTRLSCLGLPGRGKVSSLHFGKTYS